MNSQETVGVRMDDSLTEFPIIFNNLSTMIQILIKSAEHFDFHWQPGKVKKILLLAIAYCNVKLHILSANQIYIFQHEVFKIPRLADPVRERNLKEGICLC